MNNNTNSNEEQPVVDRNVYVNSAKVGKQIPKDSSDPELTLPAPPSYPLHGEDAPNAPPGGPEAQGDHSSNIYPSSTNSYYSNDQYYHYDHDENDTSTREDYNIQYTTYPTDSTSGTTPQIDPHVNDKPEYNNNNNNNNNNSLSKTWLSKIFWSAAIVFGLFSVGLAILYGVSSEKIMRVDEVGWERRIHVEKATEVVREGWHVPSGAVVERSWPQLRTFEETTYERQCRQEPKTEVSHKEYSHTVEELRQDGSVKTRDVYQPVTKTVMREVCDQVPITHTHTEMSTRYQYRTVEWKSLPDNEGLFRTGDRISLVSNRRLNRIVWPSIPSYVFAKEDAPRNPASGQYRIGKKEEKLWIGLDGHEYKLKEHRLFEKAQEFIGKQCSVQFDIFNSVIDFSCSSTTPS